MPRDALSVPEVYILADDMEGAERTLRASVANLSDRQLAKLLGSAARYGDLSILEAIIREGVDPAAKDGVEINALMAVPGGREPRIEKIELLLENGVTLDYQTDNGFSVLDAALFNEDQVTLTWLLNQLDKSDTKHVQLVDRALGIAAEIESPLSSDLDNWLE